VQGISFVTVFPLTFVANTFVPVSGLPDGLRQVAEYNPGELLGGRRADPVRQPDGAAVERGVAARARGRRRTDLVRRDLTVVIPITLRAFRKRTTG
jgi:hypothetical protein